MKIERKHKLRVIRGCFYIFLFILLLGVIIYALYLFYPDLFPGWFRHNYFKIVVIVGAIGSAILLGAELYEKIFSPTLENAKKRTDIDLSGTKKPIRLVTPEELLKRLGMGGEIPWINRGVVSTGLLREKGRIAITGRVKSGKTREAIALIDLAYRDGTISVIYEPTTALEYIDIDFLTKEIQLHVDPQQKTLFFIDELGLRAEDDRWLQRLSECIHAIHSIRPDAYFVITLQHERKTKSIHTWLRNNFFHEISLPPFTLDHRQAIITSSAAILKMQLTPDAHTLLAREVSGERPYDVIFLLQALAQQTHFDQHSDDKILELNSDAIRDLLHQGTSSIWLEQMRQIEEINPVAVYLLNAIATFISAGVTPRVGTIHHYTRFLVQKQQNDKIPDDFWHALKDAKLRWRNFDITAQKGIYSIPEPLVYPLLLDSEEAKKGILEFLHNYSPEKHIVIINTLLKPFDYLAEFYWALIYRWPKLTDKNYTYWVGLLLGRVVDWIFNNLASTEIAELLADSNLLNSEIGKKPTVRTSLLVTQLIRTGADAAQDKHFEDALISFNKALSLSPENVFATIYRGLTYKLMGRYEEALADFNRAIKLNPSGIKLIKIRGDFYRERERYIEALADFNRALELAPNDTESLNDRGLTYLWMERYEEALADFNRALELDRKDGSVLNNRGVTYLEMGRYEKALADFNHVIDKLRHEDDEAAIYNRGVTYKSMKCYEEAWADLYRAIRLKPKDESAFKVRGEIYRLVGYYEEALADFDRAIELDPEYAWAITNRGATYRLMGRYEEALADFDRAIELNPETDWFHYERGLTHLAQGKDYLAQEDFKSAISIAKATYETDPDRLKPLLNLALYLLVVGDTQEAMIIYRRDFNHRYPTDSIQAAITNLEDFLVLFPQNEAAQQAIELLQNHLKSQSD